MSDWYPDLGRVPNDFDYATDQDKVKNVTLESGMKVEYLFNPTLIAASKGIN